MKITEDLSQDRQPQGRDMNPELSEYKAGMLPTRDVSPPPLLSYMV
jgi:hypothetical protein